MNYYESQIRFYLSVIIWYEIEYRIWLPMHSQQTSLNSMIQERTLSKALLAWILVEVSAGICVVHVHWSMFIEWLGEV